MLLLSAALLLAPPPPDSLRWAQHVARTTITRDDWGIPHIRGRSDADAVFGLMVAQAEDDFPRIERNYLCALGRLAEAEGEAALWQDVRARLVVHEDSLRAMHARAPGWLRRLTQAWADGLNFHLARHPEVRPRVLTRFEPWMPFAFSEGSIGGDLEGISLPALARFYGGPPASRADAVPPADWFAEPTGSNGIAIPAANSATGHALLLINPHTTFYFRHEAHVTSDEGLDAYGALTWGQFFIYQGFNRSAGWMHTTSGVDAVDEYLETVERTPAGATYRHGAGTRPVVEVPVTIRVRTASGLEARRFTLLHTHHGPVVREQDGKWVAARFMRKPLEALQQSYLRTKARDWAGFRRVLALHANSSNNTLFADGRGDAVYVHANFVPRRDPRFDWTRPVDGSDPATEWGPPHEVEASPFVRSPATGFVYNTNNWPYSAAGAASPRASAFPAYFDRVGENPRGIHALRLLEGRRGWTLEALLAAAYDPDLPAFDDQLPPLFRDVDALPAADPRRARLAEPVALLRAWDRRWGADSRATTLADAWGSELGRVGAPVILRERVDAFTWMRERATADERIGALLAAMDSLTARFGTWQVPWGEVNRLQRISPAIDQAFRDDAPSTPVPFTSARWGSLASFGTRRPPGQARQYGTTGNSFVAVVEFGPRVRARAIMAGGQRGDAASPHFADQVARYAAGDLRPVYFWPDELEGHIERRYRPGE
ncbi:MAG: penicillin acylase family protein [Gemmatimonadales bacterium]|nr:penicillin acylase family protein [Gemmatimonadales bacterium]